jgi:DNA-binding transcriptional MerR regulator
MYIGKVAELTGATPKAIRHYEAMGLIVPPQRVGDTVPTQR